MSVELLVTGASGFVGPHLVERARTRGIGVAVCDGDLRAPGVAESAVEATRPRWVVHLAAVAPAAELSSWDALRDNIQLTASLLDAIARIVPDAGVLVPGSAAQYGQGSLEQLPEGFPTRPVSPNGAIKTALEAAVTSGAMGAPERIIWTRSFNHIGPGQQLSAPVAAWARQVAAIEAGEPGPLRTGSLSIVRDFLDVRDFADAYLDLLASGARGVVNVCSGKGIRLNDIATLLISLSDREIAVEEDPALYRAADPPVVVGDPARLLALTDWRPAYGLEQSLSEVLEEQRMIQQEESNRR